MTSKLRQWFQGLAKKIFFEKKNPSKKVRFSEIFRNGQKKFEKKISTSTLFLSISAFQCTIYFCLTFKIDPWIEESKKYWAFWPNQLGLFLYSTACLQSVMISVISIPYPVSVHIAYSECVHKLSEGCNLCVRNSELCV